MFLGHGLPDSASSSSRRDYLVLVHNMGKEDLIAHPLLAAGVVMSREGKTKGTLNASS